MYSLRQQDDAMIAGLFPMLTDEYWIDAMWTKRLSKVYLLTEETFLSPV